MVTKIGDKELKHLLLNFNSRENSAFCTVYELIYDELFYFTRNIYRDTEIVASDVIHDVFVKLWESRNVKFDTITSIKGYIYVVIRNKFKDYISHNKSKGKFNNSMKLQDDYLVSQIVESETLSIVSEAVKMLPKECAAVFKLFIEGWEVKDIALKLNKAQSTVYAQKQEAISILKRKLTI